MLEHSSYTEEELLQIQAIAEAEERKKAAPSSGPFERLPMSRAVRRQQSRQAKKDAAAATLGAINGGLRPENGNAVNWFNERAKNHAEGR